MKITDMDKKTKQQYIAKNVAERLNEGLINLGIGLPTLVANYLPEGDVILHSENGYTGLTGPDSENPDPMIVNAGGQPAGITKKGAFFDSCVSFGLVRGGALKATVLGALEVDDKGNLANYMVPGKMVPGMGGAMDLVTGAKTVIVAMEHVSKGGLKILNECKLPLTGEKCVDLIITEYCVFRITDKGLVLEAKNKDVTIDEIKEVTEPNFTVADDVKDMVEL